VAIVARSPSDVERTVTELRSEGGQALGVVADLADPGAPSRIAADVHAAFGRVDVLVHCAGTLGSVPLVPLLGMSRDAVGKTFEVNTLGPLALTRAVIGGMLLRDTGTVMTIGSDAAIEAYPTWGACGASKAALEHISRTLAAESSHHEVLAAFCEADLLDRTNRAAASQGFLGHEFGDSCLLLQGSVGPTAALASR
jgi:NAD(P)-dependent dehydrogenase (short-subunit alcohol dehydrogenase family)